MTLRRCLSTLLAVTCLTTFAPSARADDSPMASPLGPADGEVPTAKKVVFISTTIGMVAAFATSFVFLAQASGAEGEREDLLRGNGSGATDGMNAQCVTPAQCGRVAELGQDRDDAQKRWQAAMITGAVFGAASLATLILWPNVEKKKERALNIVPQSTGVSGGGVLFTGSF